MDKLKIGEVIVVEGRYDVNTLSQLVDTLIIPTAGFGIFKDKKQLALLRRLAETRGLILLTDSDGAGFVIRNHLKSAIPPQFLKNAYIPDIYGKERRKDAPGKEGKLGVEGMRPAVLEAALRQAGATFLTENAPAVPPDAERAVPARETISKADFFRLGLSGAPDSAARRQALEVRLDLPEHLSPNALFAVLNALYTPPEVAALLAELAAEK
ncbi:MAG: DUF4093 domain-containing protein [Oscillospiraceae bacterium]